MPGEMTSLAAIAGAPTRSVTLAGRDYRVGTLRPRDVADLQAFLMSTVPNPKAEARKLIEGLPVELAVAIWDRELAAAPPWPPSLDSPQGAAALISPAGMAETVYVILRHTVAGLTRERAAELADELSLEEFHALMQAVLPPRPPADGDDDPKARNGRAPTSASARS